MRHVLSLAALIWIAPVAHGDEETAPRIVAHRGLHQHAPENTMAAFAASLELRLGFELDVRRTADGVPVCLHDATVDRTTDGTGRLDGLKRNRLRSLDAGSWFDPRFRGERIPTLDEVFARIARHPDGPPIAVDLKVDDATMAEDVTELARKYRVTGRLVYIGLAIEDAGLRRRLREADATAGVACLAQTAADLEAALRDRDSDWAYVRFLPTAEEVGRARAAGKRVFAVGTLFADRRPENWLAARRAGVDALMTDHPLECQQLWREQRDVTPGR